MRPACLARTAVLALFAVSCSSSREPAHPVPPRATPPNAPSGTATIDWGEDIRADEARRASGGAWFGAEDVPLAVPRVVFFLPARVIQVGSIPLRGGLRFTQKHHVVAEVASVFSDEAEAPPTAPQVGARKTP
jgi:hypothetical protein